MGAATTHRIEALRQKLDITQKVMARILGVTERTIIDLEAGKPLSEGINRRVKEKSRGSGVFDCGGQIRKIKGVGSL